MWRNVKFVCPIWTIWAFTGLEVLRWLYCGLLWFRGKKLHGAQEAESWADAFGKKKVNIWNCVEFEIVPPLLFLPNIDKTNEIVMKESRLIVNVYSSLFSTYISMMSTRQRRLPRWQRKMWSLTCERWVISLNIACRNQRASAGTPSRTSGSMSHNHKAELLHHAAAAYKLFPEMLIGYYVWLIGLNASEPTLKVAPWPRWADKWATQSSLNAGLPGPLRPNAAIYRSASIMYIILKCVQIFFSIPHPKNFRTQSTCERLT